MKVSQLLAFVAIMLFGAGLHAAEAPKTTNYEVTMTGVTCAGCQGSVKTSLAKLKLEGVKFSAGKKPHTQILVFKSENDKLDKIALTKALGRSAVKFIVKDVKKVATQQKAS